MTLEELKALGTRIAAAADLAILNLEKPNAASQATLDQIGVTLTDVAAKLEAANTAHGG